jgi:hypothetical protein
MKTKVCRKCGKTLKVEAFSRDKTKPDGLAKQCRKCRCEYMAKYNRTNKTPHVRRTEPSAEGKAALARCRAIPPVTENRKEELLKAFLFPKPAVEALFVEALWECIDLKLEKVVEEFRKGNHRLRGELIKSRVEVFDLKKERSEMIDKAIDKEQEG